MSTERTLPIPAQQREFTVKAGGEVVPRSCQLLSVTITRAANRIAAARLVYLDGSASASDFPLSNAGTFVPGQTIEILAGAENDPVSLFKGLVVRQGIKVREHAAPQVVIDCRHVAVKLTVGRKNAYFFDQTDSDIIGALLGDAGISADVEATSATHKQQVQYGCTDWDFLLLRAEANGRLVFTDGDAVAVKKPAFDGAPVCTLLFGATMLEFDAEMDARSQYSGVKSRTWDCAEQALSEKDGADPGVTAPGNLPSGDLAGVVGLDTLALDHVAVSDDEAQAWADATWLRSQMSRVNGRIKCEGVATVKPGDIVTLEGVGDRYSGKVFVSGVRHDYDLVKGWKTHVQFGSVDRDLAGAHGVTAPKAAGLLPGVNGLQTGVVVSNEDPDGEFRVRVKLPLVSMDGEGTWARVAEPDAGDSRGFFVRPEIGDEVVLGFLNDDPRQAVVLGMLNSSAKPAPLEGSDDNHEKVFQTRSKMRIYFNDDTKVMQFETPAGNSITLSEDEKAIKVADQNGNKIELTADGIKIESAKAIELKAGTEVKMESGTSFSAKGGSDLKLQGTASAELSSSATTSVKGSLLQLN